MYVRPARAKLTFLANTIVCINDFFEYRKWLSPRYLSSGDLFISRF